MTSITVLIPTNTPLKLNDAFTTQCQNICKSLSKKIDLHVIWVMFPALPPFHKSDYVLTNDNVIFSNDFGTLNKMFEHVKPDIVFVNGSIDFHNLGTILVSRFKKIPIVTLFLRNPYGKKQSFFSILMNRFRGATAKYDATENRPHLGKLFTINFFLNQFRFIFKTLTNIEFTKIKSFMFFLQYLKIIFSDITPTHKIISGDINLCNVEKNKDHLISSNFKKTSIFVIGDPYFDNHDISKLEYIIKEKPSKLKILFVPTPNHEHGLCSSKNEFDLIINVINTILKHDIEISLKIHPSSSIKTEYVDALEGKISSPIHIFQSEDLVELLSDYNVMLTYGGTSAIHDAVLLGKPIVNLDFDNNITGQVSHYDEKIITQCRNIYSLITDIEYAYKKIINSKDVEQFFQKHLGYSNKKPSEHAAEIISAFLQKTVNYTKKS